MSHTFCPLKASDCFVLCQSLFSKYSFLCSLDSILHIVFGPYKTVQAGQITTATSKCMKDKQWGVTISHTGRHQMTIDSMSQENEAFIATLTPVCWCAQFGFSALNRIDTWSNPLICCCCHCRISCPCCPFWQIWLRMHLVGFFLEWVPFGSNGSSKHTCPDCVLIWSERMERKHQQQSLWRAFSCRTALRPPHTHTSTKFFSLNYFHKWSWLAKMHL